MTRNNKRNNFAAESNDGFKTVSRNSQKTYINNNYNKTTSTYTGPSDSIRPLNRNTQHMISRLAPLIRSYNTTDEILTAIGFPGAQTSLGQYATEFPYYRMSDVCRVFDFGSVLPGHAFEICEMLIINGQIFLSIIGIYKALILSDISPYDKFMFLQEIDTPVFDTNWITVNNMENNPLPRIDSKPDFALKYVKHDLFYGNQEISMPYLTQLLLRAQYFEPLNPDFFNAFSASSAKSHIGCITQGKKYKCMTQELDSCGLSVSGNNGLRYIAGKFRPTVTRYSADTLTALKVLCSHRARSFVSAIFANDSRYYLFETSTVFKSPGFVYEHKDSTINVGDNIDNSADNNVVAACKVYNTTTATRCIENGWSFDQLVTQNLM